MPGLLLPLKEDLTHSDLNRWAPDPRGEITGKNYQESKFVAAVRSVQMIRKIIIGMRQYHLRFIIRQSGKLLLECHCYYSLIWL